MIGLNITLTLSTLDQLRGLEAALEIYVDSEEDRSKDDGFTTEDAARLRGAKQLPLSLNGTLNGKGSR